MVQVLAKETPRESPEDIRKYYPEFEQRLQDRRHELIERLKAARSNLDEQVMTSPGDMADESVIETSADYFLNLTNQLDREISEVDQALERIRQGTYGLCFECGQPIAVERLRKLPYARLDVDCKATQERRIGPLPRPATG